MFAAQVCSETSRSLTYVLHTPREASMAPVFPCIHYVVCSCRTDWYFSRASIVPAWPWVTRLLTCALMCCALSASYRQVTVYALVCAVRMWRSERHLKTSTSGLRWACHLSSPHHAVTMRRRSTEPWLHAHCGSRWTCRQPGDSDSVCIVNK